eukprot:m.178986 g.178986  ORF g.178986 m.178986 type:complete len:333 (-) comp14662_c0_seq1:168-1166(-)
MWRRKTRKKKRPPTGAAARSIQQAQERAEAEAEAQDTPDDEAENPLAAIEQEFPGWTIQDHLKEMSALKVEFKALAKLNYEAKVRQLDEKVKKINAGTDPDFKRRLVDVEKDHKRAQALLEARKSAELECVKQLYDGSLFMAKLSQSNDRDRSKDVLIERLTRPKSPDPPPEIFGDPNDEFYMPPYKPVSMPSSPTGNERGDDRMDETDDVHGEPTMQQQMAAQYPMFGADELAATAGMHAMMMAPDLGAMPPHISPIASVAATPTRPLKPLSAVTEWKNARAHPVIYMLGEHEIEDDLARMGVVHTGPALYMDPAYAAEYGYLPEGTMNAS